VLYPVELRAPYKSTSYSAKRKLSGRCSGTLANRIGSARGLYSSLPRFEALSRV
jgi:hypothetical protein